MTTKEALYRLIDRLPERVFPEAERLLQSLQIGDDDPLWRFFMDAPVDDEPLTPEDIAAIEESRAEIDRGEGIPWEVVRAQFLDDA
ncbi:MAG: hypothetical protein ACR2PL_23710 [Dehalococcoidia bacterium]